MSNWVFRCSVESVREGKKSVLAVMEVVFASAVSIWWIWETGTLWHVIVGVAVLPLLLLRTEESTIQGLNLFSSYRGIVTKAVNFTKNQNLLFVSAISFFSLPFIPVSCIVFRFFATLNNSFQNPKRTLLSIPYNWKRIILLMDIFFPPEVMPGAEEKKYDWMISKVVKRLYSAWHDAWIELKTQHSLFEIIITVPIISIFSLVVILISYPPSILYRLSLKSTFWVYTPFVLLYNHLKLDHPKERRIRFYHRKITQSPLEWIGRIYGLITLFLFTLLPLMFLWAANWFHELSAESPGLTHFVEKFVPMNLESFNSWHLSRVIAVVFAWIILILAWDSKIERDELKQESTSKDLGIFWLMALRYLANLWSFVCFASILYASVNLPELPEVIWLPDPLDQLLAPIFTR